MPLASRLALILAVVVALFGVSVRVQGQSLRVAAGPDPYTLGQAKVLAKAGYVGLGPFSFGHERTSSAVENLLGTEPLMWIETKHFRLGCSLVAFPMKGPERWRAKWRKQVKAELNELRKVLPGIKKRPKVLDPWLRTHLFAYRLENLYDEVLSVLGVDDAWFPTEPHDPSDAEEFRGLGPYMGMKEKFTVLLLRKGASHARYMRAYHGIEIAEPMRSHDQQFGCLYWGCSQESAHGLFHNDLALHCNLVFNVAHNLYTGFRAYGHDLPAWLTTGLGHWHSRRISPRFPTYDRVSHTDADARSLFWRWDIRVHGLVRNQAFESLMPFTAREHAGKFGVEQHMQAWAFVDFLMKTHRSQVGQFLHLIKAPFHARQRAPSAEELLVRQRDALGKAFHCDVEVLDAAWRKHVLAKKPRK